MLVPKTPYASRTTFRHRKELFLASQIRMLSILLATHVLMIASNSAALAQNINGFALADHGTDCGFDIARAFTETLVTENQTHIREESEILSCSTSTSEYRQRHSAAANVPLPDSPFVIGGKISQARHKFYKSENCDSARNNREFYQYAFAKLRRPGAGASDAYKKCLEAKRGIGLSCETEYESSGAGSKQAFVRIRWQNTLHTTKLDWIVKVNEKVSNPLTSGISPPQDGEVRFNKMPSKFSPAETQLIAVTKSAGEDLVTILIQAESAVTQNIGGSQHRSTIRSECLVVLPGRKTSAVYPLRDVIAAGPTRTYGDRCNEFLPVRSGNMHYFGHLCVVKTQDAAPIHIKGKNHDGSDIDQKLRTGQCLDGYKNPRSLCYSSGTGQEQELEWYYRKCHAPKAGQADPNCDSPN